MSLTYYRKKGEQVLTEGIGSASEVEHSTEPKAARRFLDHPDEMVQTSPLVKSLQE